MPRKSRHTCVSQRSIALVANIDLCTASVIVRCILQKMVLEFPFVAVYTPWAIKNFPLHFCPYIRQLLTDYQNSFTGTLCRQFAIM